MFKFVCYKYCLNANEEQVISLKSVSCLYLYSTFEGVREDRYHYSILQFRELIYRDTK